MRSAEADLVSAPLFFQSGLPPLPVRFASTRSGQDEAQRTLQQVRERNDGGNTDGAEPRASLRLRGAGLRDGPHGRRGDAGHEVVAARDDVVARNVNDVDEFDKEAQMEGARWGSASRIRRTDSRAGVPRAPQNGVRANWARESGASPQKTQREPSTCMRAPVQTALVEPRIARKAARGLNDLKESTILRGRSEPGGALIGEPGGRTTASRHRRRRAPNARPLRRRPARVWARQHYARHARRRRPPTPRRGAGRATHRGPLRWSV